MTSGSTRVLSAFGLLLSAAAATAQVPVGGVEQEFKYDATTPGLAGQIGKGDRFGRSVATLRDFDGDGNGDLVVGAPYDDDGGLDRGAVHLLLLDADGSIKATGKISSTAGGFGGALPDESKFGNAVAFLGDVDANGANDIAVGAIGDSDGGAKAGAVWLLFLKPNGTVDKYRKLTPADGGFPFQLQAGDLFGRSIAPLPDMNGDGIPDVAIGAPGDDDAGPDAGCVYVAYIGPQLTVIGGNKITTGQSGFGTLLADGDRFGQAVASLGDLNGDGFTDLAVGAWQDDTGGSGQGALHVLLLGPGAQVLSATKLAEGLGGFDGELSTADRFGGSVTSIGDLDGDQVADLAVGAFNDDDGGVDAGAVWVLFMNPDGSAKGEQKISELEGGLVGGLDGSDHFHAVAAVQDIDGDGTSELAVGAFGDNALGANTGAVWVLVLHSSEWTDLGQAVPGVLGAPVLGGIGTLAPATEVTLTLSKGTPLAPVALVLGTSQADLPFAGGVLVPHPDLTWVPGSTNAAGFLGLQGRWPPDAPAGTSIWMQAWMQDDAATGGWAASNGLQATAP